MSAAWIAPPNLNPAVPRIRLMVVDDSIMLRHLLQNAFLDHPEIEVVAAESSGPAALERLRSQPADVVTLDAEMPGADGLETLRQLRQSHPETRVVVFSPPTRRGATAAFEAIALGADDYVIKTPVTPADPSATALCAALTAKIRQFFLSPPAPALPLGPTLEPSPRTGHFRILAIGASTGGPRALAQLLAGLPAHFPLPVMVAQHVPRVYSRVLADRLNAACPLHVVEAADGMEACPGQVLIAPGNFHLRIKRSSGGWAAALDQSPPEHSQRPAVDVLFRSLTEQFGHSVLSVVLTGAGSDGLRGAQAVKSAGGCCLAQDRLSSAVWGMPGAIAQAGLADRVLPLSQLAAELVRLAGARP